MGAARRDPLRGEIPGVRCQTQFSCPPMSGDWRIIQAGQDLKNGNRVTCAKSTGYPIFYKTKAIDCGSRYELLHDYVRGENNDYIL